MKNIFTAAALVFAVSTSAFAGSKDLCKNFRLAVANETVKVVKTVDTKKARLSKMELGMIQTTILGMNPAEPVSISKALDIFNDKVNGGDGDLGGSIEYVAVKDMPAKYEMARVTYFPGDNEYGSLFSIYRDGNYVHVGLIGSIEDSDVFCLTFE